MGADEGAGGVQGQHAAGMFHRGLGSGRAVAEVEIGLGASIGLGLAGAGGGALVVLRA